MQRLPRSYASKYHEYEEQILGFSDLLPVGGQRLVLTLKGMGSVVDSSEVATEDVARRWVDHHPSLNVEKRDALLNAP